jgi:FtsP/CotA-like multicopper oxidase with cupredoxin domain
MRRRDWLGKTIAAGMGVSAARLLEGGPLRSLLGDAAASAGVPGTLVATPATIPVWPGHPTTVLTYGGTYPSPTIRAQRGEIVDVLLDNQLGEDTNVHWHGLTVPAHVDGHPMDVVGPGASKQHTFQIVDRAGTYWYHPHPDMRTASQIYRGMAGFFIVEDPQEAALALPTGAYDVPLLIQDRRLTADFSLEYAPTMKDMMTGYLGDVALVNGVPEPELTVASAAYRFRLLNGSNARVFRVAFEDLRTFQVIGGDGGLLERPAPATSVFLAPGERVEIYVDFAGQPAGRNARLVSLPFSAGGGGIGRGMGQGDPLSLLRLVVRGTGPRPSLPATLIPLAPRPRPVVERRFVMEMMHPPVFGNFTINGLPFDPDRVDARADRGVWEVWEVVNSSAEPHPFHIHAAQFRVVSRTSGPLSPHERALKDTVLVWPAEVVKLHVRFDHYAGRYVFHCHNLEHEDMGMMATLEIV